MLNSKNRGIRLDTKDGSSIKSLVQSASKSIHMAPPSLGTCPFGYNKGGGSNGSDQNDSERIDQVS